MMKIFNSFQITAAFAAWPLLVAWLQSATFKGATIAFCIAGACYIVAFTVMVACVYNSIDKMDQ